MDLKDLRELLQKRGIKNADLAKMTGQPQTHVGRWLGCYKYRAVRMPAHFADALSKILYIPADSILAASCRAADSTGKRYAKKRDQRAPALSTAEE